MNETEESPEWRSLPHGVIDSLKKDREFWYADSAFGQRPEQQEKRKQWRKNNRSSQWLNLKTLTVILVVFILGVIFFLVKINVAGRRRSEVTKEEEPGETENIFDIRYQQEIEKAVREQNYRLAIRLMFLRLLKNSF